MSEPTHLSAERPYSRDELVHLAENMRHSTVQQIVGATEQKTINRLLATIDAQATEIAALKGALESIVAIGRLENYVELLASGERITFSPELRELAERALAGKEAQGD